MVIVMVVVVVVMVVILVIMIVLVVVCFFFNLFATFTKAQFMLSNIAISQSIKNNNKI